MTIIDISIILFCILESLNIIILYFKPNIQQGNGVGVFDNLEESKNSPSLELFVSYLINWVAGVKLIFILLLFTILLTGTDVTKICAVICMIISIAVYFWRLHPIITKLDNMNKITPKGYSQALRNMILGFMIMFITALGIYFIG
ncbi:MAG: hypothetical protein ATN31_09625 [Candidatus Epulonipiscioides saccharophilum]|nr:MAG: hypothetical protein ATN31_09625 [Epulopiscium sp. AS2M-Bin001]